MFISYKIVFIVGELMKASRSYLFCFLSLIFFIGSIFSRDTMIMNRKLKVNTGTHISYLIAAVMRTDGPVLELGCGDFSTPILHSLCSLKKRLLVTAESDKKWMRLFSDLSRDWHQFIAVKNFDDWSNVGTDVHWSVVLIDHAPEPRRLMDLKRLRNNTDIFVLHDSQCPHLYKDYVSTFKYSYSSKRYEVRTTLVSDVIDVSKFFQD